MPIYRSEKHFSTALVRVLKTKYPLVQRIESGETGRGIPDIYCRLKRTEVWLELKNDYRQSIKQQVFTFKWRPGQPGWHYRYYRVCPRGVFTVMAVKDGYVMYRIKQPKQPRTVSAVDCWVMTELHDIVEVINGTIQG
jgi:hypothetical protein